MYKTNRRISIVQSEEKKNQQMLNGFRIVMVGFVRLKRNVREKCFIRY